MEDIYTLKEKQPKTYAFCSKKTLQPKELTYHELDNAGKGPLCVALKTLEIRPNPVSCSNCLAPPSMTGLIFHCSPAQSPVSFT